MTKLEQAARQALEALKLCGTDDMAYIKSEKAITALREALAEQAEQEPIGFFKQNDEGFWFEASKYYNPEAIQLYAAPVRTKDLTGDEIDMVLALVGSDAPFHTKYRAVIAADREKNK